MRRCRLTRTLVCHPSLGVPDPKAFVVQPNRSPVVRRESYRHPLIRQDGRSARAAGVSGALSVAQLDQVVSWKDAFSNPVPNELTADARVHGKDRMPQRTYCLK